MPSRNAKVLLPVVKSLAAVRISENIATLAALAATNRELRDLCLPYLFEHVRWPHPNKHDEESGLHFFPESLWPYFKRFDLLWPDDWPDATPPRWGDRYYVGGDYHPRHTDKLATALPRMTSLISFSICCPFFPPNSLFNALLTCTSVRELTMTDTPLYISMIPKSPPEFAIERLRLIPVAEALRVGEDPYDARYSTPDVYHSREYRKKYKNDILARYAASAFLFDVGKPTSLTHVQVSGDLCTLDELAQHDWPVLTTLIMTGHPPRQTGTELVDVIKQMPKLTELRLLFAKAVSRGDATFRVLPPAPEYTSSKGNHGSMLEQIISLVVSDACNLDRVGYFLKRVQRLAMLAISDIAGTTVALSRLTLEGLLKDVAAAGTPPPKTVPVKPSNKGTGTSTPTNANTTNSTNANTQQRYTGVPNTGSGGAAGAAGAQNQNATQGNATSNPDLPHAPPPPEKIYKNRTMKHLRVMVEDRIDPKFCRFLSKHFPMLEVLEVERCGYHDGKTIYPWSEYADTLYPLRRTLKDLRLGMQFTEYDPIEGCEHDHDHACAINSDVSDESGSEVYNDDSNCTVGSPSCNQKPKPLWKQERERCAWYFAERLGNLTRVGFEYRKRVSPHRYEDRWLDWDIARRRPTGEILKEREARRKERVRGKEKARRREEERKEREAMTSAVANDIAAASGTTTGAVTIATPTEMPTTPGDAIRDYRARREAKQKEDAEEEDDSDGEYEPLQIIGLYELKPSWYPFPEIWRPVTIYDQ